MMQADQSNPNGAAASASSSRAADDMPQLNDISAPRALRFSSWPMLSTGECAELLRISIQTVIRLCDEGALPFSNIPRSKFRRVFVNDLIDFAKRNDMAQLLPANLDRFVPTEVRAPKFGAAVDKAWKSPSLTTGQVSAITCVAPRTVSAWMDSGKLHHYRIPGSRDRRCSQAALVNFMKKHGMEDMLPSRFVSPAVIWFNHDFSDPSVNLVRELCAEPDNSSIIKHHVVRNLVELGIEIGRNNIDRGLIITVAGSPLAAALYEQTRELNESDNSFKIIELGSNFKKFRVYFHGERPFIERRLSTNNLLQAIEGSINVVLAGPRQ